MDLLWWIEIIIDQNESNRRIFIYDWVHALGYGTQQKGDTVNELESASNNSVYKTVQDIPNPPCIVNAVSKARLNATYSG